MAKLFAKGGNPDQTPRFAASDLGQHCLPITLLRVSRLRWVKADSEDSVPMSSYGWHITRHCSLD